MTVKADKSRITLDTVPYVAGGFKHGDGNTYAATLTEYTAATAPADVPSGYTGSVTEVKGSSNRFGLLFDPSEYEIPIYMIEKITFRTYFLESGTNTFRMASPEASDWLLLDKGASGSWYEYSLYADGTGFNNGQDPTIEVLADEDGMLGPWGIAVKHPTAATTDVFYIDSVVITLKKDDFTAPVLNYDDETNVLTSAQKPFVPGIVAYDDAEARYVPVIYD